MEILLADEAAVDAFLEDDNAEAGVKEAVARGVGVSSEAVTVVLTKQARITTTTTTSTTTAAGTRRLQGSASSNRRLQDTETEYYVHVESTIRVATQTVADELIEDVGEVDTDDFADILEEELAEAGVDSAALSGLAVGTISEPTTEAIVVPSPSPAPSGTASGAIMRCETSSLAAFFTVSAWLASISRHD